MKNHIFSKGVAAAMVIAAIMAGQFAVVTEAQARSPHCAAIPVPGQPGHFIVRCSVARP